MKRKEEAAILVLDHCLAFLFLTYSISLLQVKDINSQLEIFRK